MLRIDRLRVRLPAEYHETVEALPRRVGEELGSVTFPAAAAPRQLTVRLAASTHGDLAAEIAAAIRDGMQVDS